MTLILRTFYDVFPEGFLWWAAENLIALGSDAPIALPPEQQIRERLRTSGLRPEALDIADASEVVQRRIASAAAVRSALGPGELVTDDRPVLEHRAARGGGPHGDADLMAVLVAIARSGLEEDRRAGPMLLWIESRHARAAGDESRADGREALAEEAGLALARRERIERRAARGQRALSEAQRLAARAQRALSERRFDAAQRDRALSEKQFDGAERDFHAALREDPVQHEARFGLAASAFERGDSTNAELQLRRLLAAHPGHAEAWNLLGAVRGRAGDLRSARSAFTRALQVDPFYPGALANAGLVAVAVGDQLVARRMLGRLRAISPLGISPEERDLADALRQAELRRKEAAGPRPSKSGRRLPGHADPVVDVAEGTEVHLACDGASDGSGSGVACYRIRREAGAGGPANRSATAKTCGSSAPIS